MKILFLDDDPTRHKKFTRAHIGLDVTYVWSAKEAIEAINATRFDQMSLDHDLGGDRSTMTTPDLGGGSGYDVAMHIAQLPPEQLPSLVVIHSMNPPGGERMAQALRPHTKVIMQMFAY